MEVQFLGILISIHLLYTITVKPIFAVFSLFRICHVVTLGVEVQFVGILKNYRSLLQKSPRKEKVIYKRDQ